MSAQEKPLEQHPCPDAQTENPMTPPKQPDEQQPEQQPEQPDEQAQQLTPEDEAKRLKRRRRLMYLLALFLLLDVFAAGVLIQLMYSNQRQGAAVRDAQAVKVGATQEMTQQERDELVAIALGQAHSLVSLRSEMQVVGGEAQLYLSNEVSSPCSVEVELMLMDSREVILRTGVIEPGWHLKTSTLNKRLAPGEYQCLARCLFYTTDDNAYLGTTARHVLLTVH